MSSDTPETPKAGAKDNIIFVGKKPAMSYVMAVVTQFSTGVNEVHVKARGKSISRAVDVAEVYRSRFDKTVNYSVDLGTDSVQDDSGNSVNVSTISILLKK